jgi:hypothetical protein
MRIAAALLILLIGCASGAPFDCPDLSRLEQSAQHDTFRAADGAIIASGRHLGHSWRIADHLPDWQNLTPLGTWTYWYPSGQVRARLTFDLSCYIQCCTAGQCPQVHAYPVGAFEFFYPSGQPRARGTFIPARRHVDTSCEGGDFTMRGAASGDSRAWSESGQVIPLDATALLQELLPFPSGDV